jgi:hypothetical protein
VYPAFRRAVAALVTAALAFNNASALAAPSPDGSTPKPTAAVFDLEPRNVSAEDSAVVSMFVRNAVVRSGVFVVVDKKNIDKVLSERAVEGAGCSGADCAIRVGKLLQVRYIVIGEYGLFEGERVMSGQVIGVDNGHIVASDSRAVARDETMKTAAEALVAGLLRVPPVPADGTTAFQAAPEGSPEPRPASVQLPREGSPVKWLAGAGILLAIFIGVIAASR